jgi:hypothetical protein
VVKAISFDQCFSVDTVDIPLGNTIRYDIVEQHPSCGGADGSITINITNGNAPLTYQWSTGVNLNSVTGLTAGW